MSNYLLIAVLSGSAGMLGWGLADFFAKKTIDKIGDMATLTWAHLFGLSAMAVLLLARSFGDKQVNGLPTNIKEYALLAFFGALQALVYFFVYRAFGKGKLSLLNPVFSSYSGLVVLLSVLVFGEMIGGWQLACLAVVFLGIISVSLDHESFALGKVRLAKIEGLGDIVTATLMAAIWTVLWGHFVAGKDWLSYAAIMYLFMSIVILGISVAQKINLRIKDRSMWKYFLLIGLSEVVAYVGVSIGYSLTSHTSVVAVLSASFSVPTLVLAYLFLKERITKFQTVGVAMVIVGVTLIALR